MSLDAARKSACATRLKVGTGVEDRTLLHLFVGQRLSPESDPGVYWLWGQDSNLRINWVTASCLTAWLPHKNLVGDLGLEPRLSWAQAKRVNPFP
jgi:hypothetical protein